MDALGAHTLVELLVRGAGNRAELLQVLGSGVTDPEVVREAERLQQPVTITLPSLGEMTLDRRVGWFEGDVLWCGQAVWLSLDTDDRQDPSGSAETATALLGDDEKWHQRIREFAVAKLLELKNESWLDEGEPRITAEHFLDRMRLETIATAAGGKLRILAQRRRPVLGPRHPGVGQSARWPHRRGHPGLTQSVLLKLALDGPDRSQPFRVVVPEHA